MLTNIASFKGSVSVTKTLETTKVTRHDTPVAFLNLKKEKEPNFLST